MTAAGLPPDTTSDAFLGGALVLLQPQTGYRAGIDAVLLAAACRGVPGERILDCGAGVGTVGLAVARRVVGIEAVLVERAAALAALATGNAHRNGLADRVRVVVADLVQPLARVGDLVRLAGTFDHVLANPPFHDDTAGTRSPDALKDGANAMPPGDLDAWVRFMTAMARPGGTATVIHRADALGALLGVLDGRFGGLAVLPIQPRAGAPAGRVIVRGVKGSRAPLTLLAPLVLHSTESHAFTPEAEAILRGGAALAVGG